MENGERRMESGKGRVEGREMKMQNPFP